MKSLLIALMCSFVATPSFAQIDDHTKLDQLTAGTEPFFDQSTIGTIYFVDDELTKTANSLDFSKVRKLVADLNNIESVWSIDKAEVCDSLSLSTAAQGACLTRNLELGLAHFFSAFQKTKRVLRAKGDEGIQAAINLSDAVKALTKYESLMCDLENAAWWGGSGQGIVTYGCLMAVTEKGNQMLTNLRAMATDATHQDVANAQSIGKSTILDTATLQSGLKNAQEYTKWMEEYVAEQIPKFFGEISEEAQKSTREMLDASTVLFAQASNSYCKAYVSIVVPTFKDQAKYGDRINTVCLRDINNQRGQDLNKIGSTLTTTEE